MPGVLCCRRTIESVWLVLPGSYASNRPAINTVIENTTPRNLLMSSVSLQVQGHFGCPELQYNGESADCQDGCGQRELRPRSVRHGWCVGFGADKFELLNKGHSQASPYRQVNFGDGICMSDQILNFGVLSVRSDFRSIFNSACCCARRTEITNRHNLDLMNLDSPNSCLAEDVIAITGGEREHEEFTAIHFGPAARALGRYGKVLRPPCGFNCDFVRPCRVFYDGRYSHESRIHAPL